MVGRERERERKGERKREKEKKEKKESVFRFTLKGVTVVFPLSVCLSFKVKGLKVFLNEFAFLFVVESISL